MLPDEVHAAVVPGLRAMGQLAGGELYDLQRDDRGNVLALDLLRTVDDVGGLAPLGAEFERCLTAVDTPRLRRAARSALDAFRQAAEWLRTAQTDGPEVLQAGARRFALTLGHALELAYTARHAQWALRHEQDERSAAAAHRLATQRTNHLSDLGRGDAEALARERTRG